MPHSIATTTIIVRIVNRARGNRMAMIRLIANRRLRLHVEIFQDTAASTRKATGPEFKRRSVDQRRSLRQHGPHAGGASNHDQGRGPATPWLQLPAQLFRPHMRTPHLDLQGADVVLLDQPPQSFEVQRRHLAHPKRHEERRLDQTIAGQVVDVFTDAREPVRAGKAIEQTRAQQ